MRPLFLTVALALLAGCGRGDGNTADAADEAASNTAALDGAPPAASDAAPPAAPAAPSAPAASGWDLQSSGDGTALVLPAAGGGTAIRLFCPAGTRRLLVNVPGFKPIGSEERLSFGGRGEAVALVAETRGDPRRGGVSGTGAVPPELARLLSGPVSASYGAQASGPHAAPPPGLARAFVAACGEKRAPDAGSGAKPPASPCLTQGDRRLDVRPLRAVGTEPFWGARIEGRCVTYSHPDDQKGTRVWTRYTAGRDGGGTWSGSLEGRRFELRTRRAPGCSDGMSDRRYPLAVELLVAGERREGCAEPL